MAAGIVMPFAGTTAPQGWLLCDGSAVSRTTYSALFAVIGTTYGAGDGSTTFNIPNLAGRVVIGSSQSHALGTTGGAETVTITAGQIPSHSHVVPQHGHGNNIAVTTPTLTHTITQQPEYEYSAPKMMNGYGDWSPGICLTETATASRQTSVSVSPHGTVVCQVSGSIDPCQAFNSGSNGSGEAHNNMQPYTAINYIICTEA